MEVIFSFMNNVTKRFLELSSSLQKDLLALKLNNRAVGDIRFEPCCSSQDARPSTSERSAESQKAVVFDNACWSVVNIPAPTAPVLRQSIALKRFLPQRRRFITLSSGLIIKIESVRCFPEVFSEIFNRKLKVFFSFALLVASF